MSDVIKNQEYRRVSMLLNACLCAVIIGQAGHAKKRRACCSFRRDTTLLRAINLEHLCVKRPCR